MVSGLHVPLVTPFDEDGAVDLAALERLAEEVLADGADGLVALATTAEASSLDERERDAVVAVCARVAAERGAALMVGAGTNDTRTTIARHEALAEVEGVDRVARRGAVLRAALGGGDRRPLPGGGGALAGAHRPLQHPVPHGARARRGGAARAGRHRRASSASSRR